MTHLEILPIAAALAFLFLTVFRLAAINAPPRGNWVLPAGLSIVFAAYTGVALVREGVIGFWTNHTANMLGNQVWFDLLLALGMIWFLVAREAKNLGMRLPLWLLFIVCSGSIGTFAMIARFTYLKERQKT